MSSSIYEYFVMLFENDLLNNIESKNLNDHRHISYTLHLANVMLHNNISADHVHNFLSSRMDTAYHAAYAWYQAGNASATHVINHLAAKHFGHINHGHLFSTFDRGGVSLGIHYDLNLPNTHELFTESYKETQRMIPRSSSLKLYRGVNIHNLSRYSPRPVESWTDNPKQSLIMGNTHVIETVVPSSAVLWAYHCVDDHNDAFIPPENELKVKNEHVLIGKHIQSVKIHTRNDFINHHNLKET